MEIPSNIKLEKKELSEDIEIDQGENDVGENQQKEPQANIEVKKNVLEKNPSQKNDLEKPVTILKLIINIIISLVLIALNYVVPTTYEQKWKMSFYMTLWSFWMNSFYIISITIIDLIDIIKKFKCEKYNNFVRNFFLRIAYTFSISIVFLYWLLILLGDEFEYNSRSLFDNCTCFLFHGLIYLFLNFDVFTSVHINKVNHKRDFIIITIMTFVYYLILGFGKYMNIYEPYDFMRMSNIRQIVGACGLIYLVILDGFVVFNLIANNYFEQENNNKIDYIKNFYSEIMSPKEEKKEERTLDIHSNETDIDSKNTKKNGNQIKYENQVKINENEKTIDKDSLISNNFKKSNNMRNEKKRINSEDIKLGDEFRNYNNDLTKKN